MTLTDRRVIRMQDSRSIHRILPRHRIWELTSLAAFLSISPHHPLPWYPCKTHRLSLPGLLLTITDQSGVPTTAPGIPVLYWRINTGSWNSAPGTSIGSNQYTFTFGAGVVLNDVVQYYIVAQDQYAPPNVGAMPSGGASGFK